VRTPVVRPVEDSDAAAWLRMRAALWPDGADTHAAEIEEFLSGTALEPLAVLIAEDPEKGPIGFAELSLRACAEGCRTSPVGYLEGWFVEAEARGRGVGRLLVEAAARWARGRGCRELASDSAAANEISRTAHQSAGFEETGLIRCYRRDL